MNGAFDRNRAFVEIQRELREYEAGRGFGVDQLAAALAACVTPDRRIGQISALCKAGEAYGYVRIDAIRDVLRGGS